MASGDIGVFRIEEMTATGCGMARAGDRRVFAEYTAPGDLARLRVLSEQKNYSIAELTEVVEPSPQRTDPLCPYYRKCGGCNFQHLNYDAQLLSKENILRESFKRIGKTTVPEIRVFPSRPWEYRNRVQFHCLPENRKKPGFMVKNGNEIIPIDDCPVADPGIRAALKGARHLFYPPPQKDRYNVYLKDGIFLSEGTKSRGKITINNRELTIDAGVFFQSNSGMLELLVNDLVNIAKDCDHSLPLGDIYCGVGTFSSFLGEFFNGAGLVEENRAAIALAKENLLNSATSASMEKEYRFYGQSADDWIRQSKPFRKNWGLLVVDPPRTGLTAAMREGLAGSGVRIIAYVSCDPATVARDCGDLAAAGYVLKELNLYDFYPQTAHIESLAVFQKET